MAVEDYSEKFIPEKQMKSFEKKMCGAAVLYFTVTGSIGVLTANWALIRPSLGGLIACIILSAVDQYWPKRKQDD